MLTSKSFGTFRFLMSRLNQTSSSLCNQRITRRSFHRTTLNLTSSVSEQSSTVDIINQSSGPQLMIQSYSEQGFRLSNGAFAVGPIILFPNVIFKWNIESLDEIHAESLALFRLLEPKLDLVLIGYGDSEMVSNFESIKRLRRIITQLGIKAEFMPTRHAVATYNFMLEDYRVVGGAFLPVIAPSNSKLVEFQRTQIIKPESIEAS